MKIGRAEYLAMTPEQRGALMTEHHQIQVVDDETGQPRMSISDGTTVESRFVEKWLAENSHFAEDIDKLAELARQRIIVSEGGVSMDRHRLEDALNEQLKDCVEWGWNGG